MTQYRLTMQTGPNPGRTHDVNKSSLIIGRDVRHDIIINEEQISRDHARLSLDGGALTVTDLGSTNGTSVNGQRLTPHTPRAIAAGDVIGLGENVTLACTLVVTDPEATVIRTEAPPPPPPPPVAEPAYTPPPPTPPAEPAKGPNWPLYIGIGCGCLTMVGCCIATIALTPVIMGILQGLSVAP